MSVHAEARTQDDELTSHARARRAGGINALVLDDGRRVRFRSIRPEDRAGLLALFERLGPESRRRRFMTNKPELSPRELTYFTEVDHVDHEAVVAIDQSDDSIVGVARYVKYEHRHGVADLAVTVADELHNMGIGTALGRWIVDRAGRNGFGTLTASTLWENRPARALLKRLDFRPRSSAGAEIDYQLLLQHLSRRE
jgi:RimJ/RimL family protein N-acetyltransferase